MALLGALIYVIYQLRLNHVTSQLREQFRVRLQGRERIARELHDTFFQGVQGLFLKMDAVVVELEEENPVRSTLEDVLAQSDEVVLGRDVVTELRNGVGDSSELITALSEFRQRLTLPHSAQFQINISGEPLPLRFGVAEEIKKIAKESLRNAFQHSRAHLITLQVSFHLHELGISIRDDGMGIDASILAMGGRRGHCGLPGMSERARQIGGHLSIRSSPTSGTTVGSNSPMATSLPRLINSCMVEGKMEGGEGKP